MHQQQQIIQSYIVLFVQNEKYTLNLYILRFEYIKDYNDLKDKDQIGGECDIIKLEG